MKILLLLCSYLFADGIWIYFFWWDGVARWGEARWSQTDTEDADEAFTRSFSVFGSIAIFMKIFIILICKHYVFETQLLINHLIATFSLRVVSK